MPDSTPCEIRETRLTDREAVLDLVRGAFDPGDEEVALVKAVWESDAHLPALDLVAVIDGEIVGHVLHSTAKVEDKPVVALAPLAVTPAHQKRGIGGALMGEALRRADEAGYPMVVLLGHPEYYPRFGFVPAMTLGLTYANRPAPFLPFQARPLRAYDPETRGRFVYAWESRTAGTT